MAGFGDFLKGAFPFISAAASLGGPVGTMAASTVGKAFGIDKVDPTPDGIGAAIAAAQVKDPDALLKLQQAEESFKLQMAQMGIDSAEKLESIAAADRAGARAREVAVKDKVPMILAFLAVVGLYGVIAAVLRWPIPPAAHDLLLILIGTLVANANSVYQYYFGSSSGSAEKTALLSQGK